MFGSVVELCRRKICRGLTQNLIGLAQFLALPLQRLQPGSHLCRHARRTAGFNIGLLYPFHQAMVEQPILPAIEVAAAHREMCLLS